MVLYGFQPSRHGGAEAQDRAAEALFHSYFAKEILGLVG